MQPTNNKAERCEVCGSSGCAEYIATCVQCNSSHVHTYCVNGFKDIWICEECSEIVGNASDDSRKYSSSRKQGVLEKGKVKFIPAEEAIKLSSEGLKDCSNLQRRVTSGPGSSQSVLRGGNIWSPQAKWTKRPSDIPVGSKNPPAQGSMQDKPLTSQRAPQFSKRLKESLQTHILESKGAQSPSSFHKLPDKIRTSNTNKERRPVAAPPQTVRQSVYACAPPKGFAFSNTRIKKVKDRTSCSYSEEAETPPTGGPAATNAKTGSEDFRSFYATLEKYKGCLPAAAVPWRGGFYIWDNSLHSRFYELKAVTPCRVRRQIYNLFPKMQCHLPVKFDPRNKHWEDLLMDDSPDLDDVGIYFYPCESDSSKKKFSFLYEFMKNKDLMIQSYMEGVELLIYTSKQLSLQSQNLMKRLGNEYFLWGIFRDTKKNLKQSHVKYGHDSAPMDNADVVDMEVDMVGGKDVGFVDIVIRSK